MKYSNVIKGIFIERPNRFIAKVEIDGQIVIVHVKNTGRCRELLIPGCTVYLEKSTNPNRKTPYDLIAVVKQENNLLINMDSNAPNCAAYEWIENMINTSGDKALEYTLKREVVYGDSRLDLCIEGKTESVFIEVKGVTLEKNGIALFPDAPTQRGVKHIKELEKCVRDGHRAYLLFVIQMKGPRIFKPNTAMHEEFACALCEAKKAGVEIIAMDCKVTPNQMTIDESIEVVV